MILLFQVINDKYYHELNTFIVFKPLSHIDDIFFYNVLNFVEQK